MDQICETLISCGHRAEAVELAYKEGTKIFKEMLALAERHCEGDDQNYNMLLTAIIYHHMELQAKTNMHVLALGLALSKEIEE